MILLGARHIAHLLAKDVPVELGSRLAGRTDIRNRKSRVVGHGHERGLPVTRVALQAHLLRVDSLVGFEVVQRPARSPRPRRQRSPIVQLARLALVDQANDALGQTRAVVGLHAGGHIFGVAPASRQYLLLPCRPLACRPCGELRKPLRHLRHEFLAESQLHDHWHRPPGTGGSGHGEVDVDGESGVGRVVHVPRQRLGDHGHIAVLLVRRAHHFPGHPGQMRRHAPINFAVEQFHNLRTPPGPPRFGGGHALAVVQPQRIGQRGIHICLRFVVVGGAWRLGIPVCSRPQFLDAKLVHHPLVILL